MHRFWDVVAGDIGPAVGVGLGVILLLFLAYGFFSFVGGAVWMFTVELYRAVRYDRHGVCYKCKKPFAAEVTAPADQMFGPSRISQGVCSCGTVSIVRGNRRFAEW